MNELYLLGLVWQLFSRIVLCFSKKKEKKKTHLTIKNYFPFSIFKNKKYGIFR